MLSLPVALGAGCDDFGGYDGGLQVYCPPAFFTKAEALVVVERALVEADWSRPDGCPTVPDRWMRNERYRWTPPDGVSMSPIDYTFDWLAPAEALPADATCPGANVKTVGIAVWGAATTERPMECNDTACYSMSVDYARRNGDAALAIVDTQTYPFITEDFSCEPGPSSPTATREEAEATLAADVRGFLAGLRSDGFL
jgi:hypothetical protein